LATAMHEKDAQEQYDPSSLRVLKIQIFKYFERYDGYSSHDILNYKIVGLK
jgi:hypothetical protein